MGGRIGSQAQRLSVWYARLSLDPARVVLQTGGEASLQAAPSLPERHDHQSALTTRTLPVPPEDKSEVNL